MPDNQAILNDLINNVKNDVINSLQANGRFATGQTIAGLETVITDNGGQLIAPAYIDALEYGRKPTGSNPTPGDPPMIDNIRAWVEAKGIDINPWAIKKSIDKKGYPGKPGVLTEPLSDDNINSRVNEAAESIATNLQNEVADLFNVLELV